MGNKEICSFDFKHDSILAILLEQNGQNPQIDYCLSVPVNHASNLSNFPELFKALWTV